MSSLTRWPPAALAVPAVCLLLASGVLAVGAQTTVANQGRQDEQRVVAQKPFIFRPPPGIGRFPDTLVRDWMAAVDSHVVGARDEPLRAVAAWAEADVGSAYAGLKALLETLDHNRLRPRMSVEIGKWQASYEDVQRLLRVTDRELADNDFGRIIERAALLHTDIGVVASREAGRPDAIADLPAGALHFGVAMELVDLLSGRQRAKRAPATDTFPKNWYTTVAAFLTGQYELVSTPIFLDRTLSRYGDDASVFLMAGSVQEHLASPAMQSASGTEFAIPSLQAADYHLKKAEDYYRSALKTAERDGNADAATAVEARLRLGRVLGLRGRHEQALASLRLVRVERVDTRLQYILHLSVGQECEAVRDVLAARAAYERAVSLLPLATSARLSWSLMERKMGDRARAIAELERVMKLQTDVANDPMETYYAGGDAQRSAALLLALESTFRNPQ